MVPGKFLIHAVMASDPSHAFVAASQMIVVPTKVSDHSNGHESRRYYSEMKNVKGVRVEWFKDFRNADFALNISFVEQ